MSAEVWITGAGAVTAAGAGMDALQRLLEAERSAVRADDELGGRVVGACPDVPRSRLARRMDRSGQLFHAACTEAWAGAGLEGAAGGARAGLIEGSSLGPMAGLLDDYRQCLADPRERNHPSRLTRFMTGIGGAVFAHSTGIRGPVMHLSAGSVSSGCAIGEGYQRVAAGDLDLVVVGGAEAPLHPEILGTFALSGVLAPDLEGETPCRPFDARRAGTVLGEGGAALVLESAGHARARGATPLACIIGYGLCTETFDLVAPDPSGSGVQRAAEMALRGRSPHSIAWVKAHGTGTRLNDAAEACALQRVFGQAISTVPVVSLKSAVGHCLGASGAVEAAAAILALQGRFAPATVGFGEPDPELPIRTVAATRQAISHGAALLLSESFGGRCVALLVGSVDGTRSSSI